MHPKTITKTIQQFHNHIRSNHITMVKKASRFVSNAYQISHHQLPPITIHSNTLNLAIQSSDYTTLVSLLQMADPQMLAAIADNASSIVGIIHHRLDQYEVVILCGLMALHFEQFAKLCFEGGIVKQLVKQLRCVRSQPKAFDLYLWVLCQVSLHSKVLVASELCQLGQLVEGQFMGRQQQNCNMVRIILYLSEVGVFSDGMLGVLCKRYPGMVRNINRTSILLTIHKLASARNVDLSTDEAITLIQVIIQGQPVRKKHMGGSVYSIIEHIIQLSPPQAVCFICQSQLFPVELSLEYFKFMLAMVKRLDDLSVLVRKGVIQLLVRQLDNHDKMIVNLCLLSIKHIVEKDSMYGSQQLAMIQLKSLNLLSMLQFLVSYERGTVICSLAEQILQLFDK